MISRVFIFLLFVVFTISLQANKIDKKQCNEMGENFIFTGGECLEFVSFEGESNEHIMLIVHGIWDEGTNTLGRYAPFAESMNMNTDLTTIAVALPGYSKSSTNKLLSLANKKVKNLAATKEYVLFIGDIIESFKKKYKAKKITYIGHSAGARMGATLMGLKPELIDNIALVGGRYEVRVENKDKNYIALKDVIKNVDKSKQFLFVYGTEDKISKPEVTTEFFKIAKENGLNAKLIKVEGAGHIDLDMTDESVEAITLMVEEE